MENNLFEISLLFKSYVNCILIVMEEYNRMYPELKEVDGNNFRLDQISKYLSELEQEFNQREQILKKYNGLIVF